jgi:hypothetical protein
MRPRIVLALLVPATLLLLARFAHPFLAMQHPIGAEVVVVEGWLHDEQLAEAAAIIRELRPERVYITGTLRPFNHYLGANDTLRLQLKEPFQGALQLNIAGVETGAFTLEGDGRVLVSDSLHGNGQSHGVEVPFPVKEVVLWSSNLPGRGLQQDNLVVLDLRLDGTNAHRLMRSGHVLHADGGSRIVRRDHAAHARDLLEQHGVPLTRMVAISTDTRTGRRSWTMARKLAQQLQADTVKRFDVITMGVHGRRSRMLFSKACGAGCEVGVISLDDQLVPAAGWWRMPSGWMLVFKEFAGLAATPLFTGE